jgi:2-amino-4-hydroxy-6-hydroxymethyldihydropteridine diphosphokinase
VAAVTAYIGLGANLARPREQLRAAFDELARLPGTRLAARSALYRSAPLGYAEQPDFVNAVARIETELPPERLLAALHEIESRHGRERSFANAPRTLDLDLLLYGDRAIERADLSLPHPRMHERAFVLAPLVELDPEAHIPGRGRAALWLARCAGQRIERIAE